MQIHRDNRWLAQHHAAPGHMHKRVGRAQVYAHVLRKPSKKSF
jgi:hypothetical protein